MEKKNNRGVHAEKCSGLPWEIQKFETLLRSLTKAIGIESCEPLIFKADLKQVL